MVKRVKEIVIEGEEQVYLGDWDLGRVTGKELNNRVTE